MPEELNASPQSILCIKTDPDLTRICNFTAKDLILTGLDKGLKRYKFPEEKLEKLDLKVKLPALAPIEDI